MFEKLKGIAGSTVDGVASTVRSGAASVVDAAGSVANTFNEKAVHTAVQEMRTVLQIAAADLQAHPVVAGPVTLTASVDLVFTALQMQVVIEPQGEPRVDEVPPPG
ncbi:hypothetical protein [Rivibacter subsaxonicus]|uniref:Uncharacterized protein n=1 Tax=Rivibacter subsaxonicus TaxID=457575 RepID=A0A4V6MER3_9BURK|nr:hypothetical protein [Rivibacter subsaxonicus]RZU02746.1 hypothetical protein EV670_0775 [Rivibacter subsaxonicus]